MHLGIIRTVNHVNPSCICKITSRLFIQFAFCAQTSHLDDPLNLGCIFAYVQNDSKFVTYKVYKPDNYL